MRIAKRSPSQEKSIFIIGFSRSRFGILIQGILKGKRKMLWLVLVPESLTIRAIVNVSYQSDFIQVL